MSEPNTAAEARQEIQALLDRVENKKWAVVDYDPTIDPYDTVSVTVTIERRALADVPVAGEDDARTSKTVKDVIAALDAEVPEGAHVDAVIDECRDRFDLDAEAVQEEIEILRTKGEIYEPKEDHLRAT